MGSCILPNSYKVTLLVSSSTWVSWWMANLHESSICLLLVYNCRFIHSITNASKCNITGGGVMVFLTKIVSYSYNNIFCGKTVLIFLVQFISFSLVPTCPRPSVPTCPITPPQVVKTKLCNFAFGLLNQLLDTINAKCFFNQIIHYRWF